MRRIVTSEDVIAGARDGAFVLLPGDVLSPLVHEAAKRHGIALVAAAAPAASGLRVRLWLPGDRNQLASLARGLDSAPPAGEERVEVVPFPWLSPLRARPARTGVSWAVLSTAAWDQGAYTGEVSARMAADAGATATVLGLEDPWTTAAQRALLPRRVERAVAQRLVAYVAVALEAAAIEGVRAFAGMRARVEEILAAAGAGRELLRWFWSHPDPAPPRSAPLEEYVRMLDDTLGAPGSAGVFDPAGREAAAAFRVEVARS